jgi:hypothetical protein
MKAYKGFDKNMQCKGFQFEEGKEYTHSGPIEICKSGFHSCENPIDIFNYYPINNSRYFECEADGEIKKQDKQDSKICCSKIKIGAEINLKTMIDVGIKFIFEKIKNVKSGNYSPAATSGNYSHAATSGDFSHAATSGNYSHAATSGYSSHAATSGNYSPAATLGNYSHAATSGYSSPAATSGNYSPAATLGNYSHAATLGKNSISCSIGKCARARSTIGNWLVLAEYDTDGNVKSVKTIRVDGKKIKADTWYKLLNGKFVKAKD